jgi:hypothetical protein
MTIMAAVNADLIYDPNDVGSDCVVRCRISNGPRSDDPAFDPIIGDTVSLIDDDGEVLHGRVTARDDDRVWVQTDLRTPDALTA